LVLEQGCFLLSGLLVWLTSFGGSTPERASRGALGVVALLLTSMHMTLLGALLALPPRALYAHSVHGAGGLSPLEDQHLGGAIMLIVGGVSYLAGGLWLAARLLERRRFERSTAATAATAGSGSIALASEPRALNRGGDS
jgi:putative membrane protein